MDQLHDNYKTIKAKQMKTKLGGWEAPTFQEERDRATLEENQRIQTAKQVKSFPLIDGSFWGPKEEEAKISPTSHTRLFQLTKN